MAHKVRDWIIRRHTNSEDSRQMITLVTNVIRFLVGDRWPIQAYRSSMSLLKNRVRTNIALASSRQNRESDLKHEDAIEAVVQALEVSNFQMFKCMFTFIGQLISISGSVLNTSGLTIHCRNRLANALFRRGDPVRPSPRITGIEAFLFGGLGSGTASIASLHFISWNKGDLMFEIMYRHSY